MSQFSEMMGSFIRTGNYPMEANYIFPTEAALKEFYNDPINATTLHKGLLKIVENGGDGKQALYWVVKKQTNDDLEFVKLIENIDIDTIDEQLEELQNKLEEEIRNRKNGETAIWGTTDPTNVPEELNSLLDLATAVTNLTKEVQDFRKSFKAEIKATVGTQEDDIVSYLKTLPYKSLTETANALNKFLNTTDADSNQINTLPELQLFLEGYTDTQKLCHVLLDLQAEILGNPLPTQEFRTLRAIEDFVRILKADSETTDKNIQSELDNTQIGVGLSGDGSYNADKETYYLKDATSIMNALKVLDSLMYEAIKGITIQASNEDVVNLNVRKELEGYVIGAKLNLSNVLGNDLVKKDDGLYFNVKSTYNNGTLSLYVNDKLVSQHILGFSSIVESAFYDSSNESIVIVFKLLSGEEQTVTVPVGTLIRELEVDNSQPNKVVELVRETVVDGADKLSADVRIHSDRHNILKKVGNALSVDGTTDSITHNDKTLSSVIEEIKTTEAESTSNLTQKITAEADRATEAENVLKVSVQDLETKVNQKADIVSPIFTGIPQIQNSPDENDSSQRIPTTNWVNTKVLKSEERFNQHIKDKQNPHNVTAEQVGSYTKLEVDSKFNKIDEITNKCVKATDEASKINATLDIDTNILTVTDRNGISTSLEVWGTTDEHISVYLSSEDGLAVVSGLDVSLIYVGTDQVYHATTDDNGICQFIVPNGIKYRVILPEIQDYLTPSEEEHMASIASRSIEHRYRRIGEEVEQVYIQVNQMENGVYSPIENHQVKLKIGTGTTSTYYTPKNGTLVLNIPSGQEYVIDIATKENYYIRGQKYHYEFQATEIRRYIYVNFRAYESGIWIVTDQNEEVTYEDWIQQNRDPKSAQLIKIATGELSAAGGVYYLKIDDLRFRKAPSHQWSSQNILFTSIPENGNSLTADYYYDGYTSSKNIQQEGDTRTIDTNAVDYALAQTLQIGELTLNGFIGSCGQWATIWRNKEHIDDILEVVRPDLGDDRTYYLFSDWTVNKWASSQYGVNNAWFLSSVFDYFYKVNGRFAVLVFYAPS